MERGSENEMAIDLGVHHTKEARPDHRQWPRWADETFRYEVQKRREQIVN